MAEVGAAGGVAFWAHIGGFITGFVLALLVRPGQRDAFSARDHAF